MTDAECVAFLQWALPRLRWQGFRKVRRQVCRRVKRRVDELGLAGIAEYRVYLEATPEEWTRRDDLCHITISRFYRDRGVFDFLRATVLPELARGAAARGAAIEAWSAGCASGEEPYTLALIWHLAVGSEFPGVAPRPRNGRRRDDAPPCPGAEFRRARCGSFRSPGARRAFAGRCGD